MALQWKNFLRSYNPNPNHLFANGLQMKKASQREFAERLCILSGPTWARTRDHLIMSQVL